MKKQFDRVLSIFMLTALLFALVPGFACTAEAEEWVEGFDVIEESYPADEEQLLYEADSVIIDEESFRDADAPQDTQLFEEELITESAEILETVLEETVENIEENASPADKNAAAEGAQTGAKSGDADTQEHLAADIENAVLAAVQTESKIAFFGRMNADGNLDFCITLPEDAGETPYTIITDDGQGGMETFENGPGETEITVFSNVMPCQFAYNMTVTVFHEGNEIQYSIWDYLRQVPQQYAGLDMSQLVPANKALCSGGIEGVYDYCAKMDFSDGDTGILLYFRAEDAADLRFTCSGHGVTAPECIDYRLWAVRVTGISVKELPTDITIIGEKDGQKVELRYSPFCDAAMHWEEDTPYILLCRALTAVIADAERSSAANALT